MDSDFFNPPLTERLKQILDKYPDGGQILKVLNTLDSQTKDKKTCLGDASECRGRRGFRSALCSGFVQLLQREDHGSDRWQE